MHFASLTDGPAGFVLFAVSCGMPADQHLLISGAADSTLRVWAVNYSGHGVGWQCIAVLEVGLCVHAHEHV